MFKARLGPWGLNKNSKNNDWGAIAKLHKIRKESGKSATEFLVHGRKRTLAQLRKHIKSKSMTDQQFLAAALELEIPSYIRCYTPDSEDATFTTNSTSQGEPESASAAPANERSHSSPTPLRTPQVSVASLLNQQSQDNSPLPEPKSSSQVISETPSSPQAQYWNLPLQLMAADGKLMPSPTIPELTPAGPVAAAAPCRLIQSQLNQMAKQALVPFAAQQPHFEDLESWVFLTNPLNGMEDGPVVNCSQCNQSVSSHLNILDDYVLVDRFPNAKTSSCPPQNFVLTSEHRAAGLKWVVRCFSACIYMTHGTSTFAEQSLADAECEVQNMLATNNPLILTSLNLILSILHVHDQGQIVESIVGSALKVANNMLGCESPVTVTIAWMTAAAGQKLPQPGLDADALRQVYAEFTKQLGDDHPHSITALYNLSWNLIIDGEWSEAESNLRRLHEISCRVLGPSHMQSITALTSLSRVLSNQNQNEAATKTMQEAIERSENTLGPSHPYRLESKRRLALMYEKVNDKPRMESLYWDVLRGRVKMLGRTHPYTIGAKVDLVQLLRDLKKWDDEGEAKRAVDALFQQQDDFKALHEAF
jgi:Tetratricopeptide repeat